MAHRHPVLVANQLLILIIKLATNLVITILGILQFGSLGTFIRLTQGHEIEKLHVMAGSKLLKKCFHRYCDSLLLILVEWSLSQRSIIGNVFQILGKCVKQM